MNNEIESQDNVITRLISVLVTAIFLVFSFCEGMPFTWTLPENLLTVFESKIAQPKLGGLIGLWRATLILGLLLLILSLFFAYRESVKADSSSTPLIYELLANTVIIVGSIVLMILFHYECSLESTTQSLAGFVLLNAWFLLVLIIKGLLFFLSGKTLKLLRLIPALLLVAAFVGIVAFVVIRPMKNVGYENYRDDVSHVEELVEDKAVNSLNSTVSIDDTIYTVLKDSSSENGRVRELVRISKNGEVEILDDKNVQQQNVTNYRNTIFYEKYYYQDGGQAQLTLCSLNVKDQSRDEFSADDVPEDLKYLFLNRTLTLLSVRGEHLYFSVYEDSIYEIWRIKVSSGVMDKSSLEKYAWNCKTESSLMKVCYQNLQYCYSRYDTDQLVMNNAGKEIRIFRDQYSSSSLGIETKWPHNYDLYHISSGSGLKKDSYHNVEKALAVSVYMGKVYYALLDGSELQIYKDDLDLASPMLVNKYEVDSMNLLNNEHDCKLLISDSYLVFFHQGGFEVSTI